MTEGERAAEHLRVIRSLMERATVYRAISWPTALFGGTLAVVLAVLLFSREEAALGDGGAEVRNLSDTVWVVCWLVVLAVTGAFNTVLILRKTQREKGPFFSPGLKTALRALVPPMLAGGVVGIAMALTGLVASAAAIWVVFYGLALLATVGMAPKSIPRLGWLCVVFGAGAYLHVSGLILPGGPGSPMLEANLIMGIGFGVLHLIYGLVVMLAGREPGDRNPDPAA